MIFDKLENLENYKNAHPNFEKALPYIKELLLQNPENGKHYMPGCDPEDAVYVNIFDYDTKPMGDAVRMEAHHRYIDVQIMLEGEEYMYVPATDDLTLTVPYDADKDCKFMAMPPLEKATKLTVPKGYFAIFFANEPHAPSVSMKEVSTHARKAVGKVLD